MRVRGIDFEGTDVSLSRSPRIKEKVSQGMEAVKETFSAERHSEPGAVGKTVDAARDTGGAVGAAAAAARDTGSQEMEAPKQDLQEAGTKAQEQAHGLMDSIRDTIHNVQVAAPLVV